MKIYWLNGSLQLKPDGDQEAQRLEALREVLLGGFMEPELREPHPDESDESGGPQAAA